MEYKRVLHHPKPKNKSH